MVVIVSLLSHATAWVWAPLVSLQMFRFVLGFKVNRRPNQASALLKRDAGSFPRAVLMRWTSLDLEKLTSSN